MRLITSSSSIKKTPRPHDGDLTHDYTPTRPESGTGTETLSAPDLWMIRPKPRRHLSYRLQNVTSALGVLFSTVFRFASQSEKRNKNRIVNKIVISRNFVDCLQWWYGSDSEKNRGRVWRLCWGSDKSFEQFSHNHCQVSQMLSHSCLAQISLNWPVAWTRTERREKKISLCNRNGCFRLGIWSQVSYFWDSISYKSFKTPG